MSLILSGTDGLSDVDGSAATPAIRGTDTNTGIFFPAADTIAFSEGGAEAVRINSSGNVGIGTSSPAYKLDVTGAINATNTSNTTVASAGFDAATSWGLGIANASTTAGTGAGIYFLGGTNSESYIGNLYESSGAGALSFQTRVSGSRAERMRIDSSGNLLVGVTSGSSNTISSGNSYAFYVAQTTTNNSVVRFDAAYSSGTINLIAFYAASTYRGAIQFNGTSIVYATSSDYRLKEDIAPMTGALATVTQLKPVKYKWKSNGSDGQGFIAHELQAVVPDCVTGEKDAVDADGKPQYQGIDTSFLVATLTAAIQEQQALITQLQADVSALKGQP